MTRPVTSPSGAVIPSHWHLPERNVSLMENRADLWLARITQPVSVLSQLYDILPDEERRTADRQVTQKLRERSIVARGLLRMLIGRYLGKPPVSIAIRKNKYGKPCLTGEYADQCMFNKSHSGGFLFYGFTSRQEIGVDLECIRKNINLERLARRQLTQNEYDCFLHLPYTERLNFFYQTWTRKEAVGKAVGKGLIFQMGSIDVSGTPDSPAVFLRQELAGSDPNNWFIRDIPDICKGFRASVSTFGRIETVDRYHADPENLLLR